MRTFDEKDFDIYGFNTRTGVKNFFFATFYLKGVSSLLTVAVTRTADGELRLGSSVPIIAFIREHIVTDRFFNQFAEVFLRIRAACNRLLASCTLKTEI